MVRGGYSSQIGARSMSGSDRSLRSNSQSSFSVGNNRTQMQAPPPPPPSPHHQPHVDPAAAPPQKKTRGPTYGVKLPKEAESKKTVTILLNTFLELDARTKICPLFKQHFKKASTKFEDRRGDRDKLWGEYPKYFWIKTEEDEARGRVIWEKLLMSISHATGNTPHEVAILNLARDLKRPPTQSEAFRCTCMKKKKGTEEMIWVTEEARMVDENYNVKLLEKYGDSGKPVNEIDDDNLEVWQEVVGGPKKGRLFGRPEERWSTRKKVATSVQFATQEANRKVDKLENELARMKERETQWEAYMTEMLDAHE